MSMTIEEKRNAIRKHCDYHGWCEDNKNGTCKLRNRPHCYATASDEEINENYKILFGEETSEPTDTPNDIINHPSHYCREDAMESIDEMVLVFGRTAVMHFCLLNVWKYRYRSSSKNGEEDLKKSDWYMRKYKELSNGE